MYSDNFRKYSSIAFDIGRKLGSSPIVFDTKSLKFTVHPTSFQKLKTNFVLAVFSVIIAITCAVKAKLSGILGNHHLTMAWCLGYNLVFLVFGIARLSSCEVCAALNKLTMFLIDIKGKENKPYFKPNQSFILIYYFSL